MAACSSTQVQFGPQQSILSLLTSASVGGIKTDLSVRSRSQLVYQVKVKKRKSRDTKTPELWLTIKLAHIFFLPQHFSHGHSRRTEPLSALKFLKNIEMSVNVNENVKLASRWSNSSLQLAEVMLRLDYEI